MDSEYLQKKIIPGKLDAFNDNHFDSITDDANPIQTIFGEQILPRVSAGLRGWAFAKGGYFEGAKIDFKVQKDLQPAKEHVRLANNSLRYFRSPFRQMID